ncbi:NAD-dependent epimerase/dehydratase family protein [Undibacterium fentianense]|uniref:NAD(P)-dependent oxidoreductase n=1 Tax=Undibacterium fentianense TaxID=2828728 RepID=A0A941E3U3_9BURK|nr:NAD-dependent epimerase/dehydratase family protein [Undibacterium fentianense]MBR7800084.1 NAD(P)-dependent oxidoreductase [Undibacterium fentianense]
MIVGHGLIARSFASYLKDSADICLYAAGVSNSSTDVIVEFERERHTLLSAIAALDSQQHIIYLSTCHLVEDGAAQTPYMRHKLAMEEIVQTCPSFLIVRLPLVVGYSNNPHTLLNYLANHIRRSYRFTGWTTARRGLIDAMDMARIVNAIVQNRWAHNCILSLAGPQIYTVPEIVSTMAEVIGRDALVDWQPKVSDFKLNPQVTLDFADRIGMKFGENYLFNTLHKYYSTMYAE